MPGAGHGRGRGHRPMRAAHRPPRGHGYRYYGHARRGPWGTPWVCWPFILCMLFFFLASIGISMIQAFVTCATNESGSSSHSSSSSSRPGGKDDDTADKVSTGECEEYEGVYVIILAVVMLCCCCCIMGGKNEGYDAWDGTQVEREPMLATEAVPPPPPTMVYGNSNPVYASVVASV